MAALCLLCCPRAFYSLLWCMGFSLRWLLLLRSTGSRRAGFSSCSTQAWLLRGVWDLPGPGLEPVSPALAGRFLTTVPPVKSLLFIFNSFSLQLFFSFFSINFFICFYFWLSWGLRCCAWAFSSCSERELLFVAVRGLLIVVVSLVEHGLQARGLQ